MKPKIDHETLTRILDYDLETGIFYWKEPTCTQRVIGDIAGTKQPNDYIRIMIFGRNYYAHRLALFYVNGAWPPETVDHINLVRSDNRFANLREATDAENKCNVTKRRDSTSGFKGVRIRAKTGKAEAQIRINGKWTYLGTFSTPEEAHAAYAAASQKHHGEYGRTS